MLQKVTQKASTVCPKASKVTPKAPKVRSKSPQGRTTTQKTTRTLPELNDFSDHCSETVFQSAVQNQPNLQPPACSLQPPQLKLLRIKFFFVLGYLHFLKLFVLKIFLYNFCLVVFSFACRTKSSFSSN